MHGQDLQLEVRQKGYKRRVLQRTTWHLAKGLELAVNLYALVHSAVKPGHRHAAPALGSGFCFAGRELLRMAHSGTKHSTEARLPTQACMEVSALHLRAVLACGAAQQMLSNLRDPRQHEARCL